MKKKTYVAPSITVVAIESQCCFMAGSPTNTVTDNRIIFDSDDESETIDGDDVM